MLLQKSCLVLRIRLLILSKTSSISGVPSLGGGWSAFFWRMMSLVWKAETHCMLPSSLPDCLSILGLLLSCLLMVVVLWKIGEMLLRERVGVVGGDLSGGDEVEGDLGGDELRWGEPLGELESDLCCF